MIRLDSNVLDNMLQLYYKGPNQSEEYMAFPTYERLIRSVFRREE